MANYVDIQDLMSKPLWQMTGEEYVSLHVYATEQACATPASPPNTIVYKTGVRALAEYLSCCETTIYLLKRDGVLDDAIVSRVGKHIVFDAEKARHLADEYKQKERAANRNRD